MTDLFRYSPSILGTMSEEVPGWNWPTSHRQQDITAVSEREVYILDCFLCVGLPTAVFFHFFLELELYLTLPKVIFRPHINLQPLMYIHKSACGRAKAESCLKSWINWVCITEAQALIQHRWSLDGHEILGVKH